MRQDPVYTLKVKKKISLFLNLNAYSNIPRIIWIKENLKYKVSACTCNISKETSEEWSIYISESHLMATHF